jgi:carbon monoxide dehydrogenase subunit G
VARQQARDPNEIAASGYVAARPEVVFGFLCDLENHWLLADRFIEVVSLEAAEDGRRTGGHVRVRGPLGLGRTVETQVVEASPFRSLSGTAALSRGTLAVVRWTLTDERAGTRIELSARIERAGGVDRVLLALGGRRWMRQRFASIVTTLARRLERAP